MPETKTLMDDLPHYLALMRMEKPIGWLLLLWPTMWALWVAADGDPSARLVWVFALGVIVMRSAGCVINDYADRDFDPLVERTQQRPLAAGSLQPRQALILFAILSVTALGLLILLPPRVWPWAVPAMLVTILYPFMKRFIEAPQLVLGLAFSFGIPMVFVACGHPFDASFWLLISTNFLWVIVFDTAYAMSDREDDLKIGVKSTAILFGEKDKLVIGVLQILITFLLLILLITLNLSLTFMLSILIVAGLFGYQQWLIRDRERGPCFDAFLNNGWVGAVVWFGLLAAL